jgi:hypothetical protein
MKFICLGYFDEDILDEMELDVVNAFIDECLAYGAELKKAGHILGFELLQSPDNAKSIRSVEGKLVVIDGPVAKMEKVIIPIITLEAQSIDHAVEIISKHPGLKKSASFEIRPADDMDELIEQHKKERG